MLDDDDFYDNIFEELKESAEEGNPFKTLGWDVDRVKFLKENHYTDDEIVQLAEGELRNYSKIFHPDRNDSRAPNLFAEMTSAVLKLKRSPSAFVNSYINFYDEIDARFDKLADEILVYKRANKRVAFIRKPEYATTNDARLGNRISILTTSDYSVEGVSVEEIGVFEVLEDFTLTARRGEIPQAEWDEEGFNDGTNKITYSEQAFLDRLCSPLEVEFERGCWFGTRYYDEKYGFAKDKFDIEQFASEPIPTKDMVVMGFCRQIEDDFSLTTGSSLALKAGSKTSQQDFLTIPDDKLVKYLVKMSQSPSEQDSIVVARSGSKRVEYLISKHKVKSCSEVR